MLLAPGQSMPWETPGSLNNTWGYSARCSHWKSEAELIYTVVNITSRDNAVYAIGLVWPVDGRVLVTSMAGKTVKAVSLLGTDQPVPWSSVADGLAVTLLAVKLGSIGFVMKIER